MKFFLFIMLLVGDALILRSQTVANFVSLTPCRVVDTRESARGSLGAPMMAAQEQRILPIMQSSCGIPANALAYALNITVIPHGSLPWLTVWPTGQEQPVVSTLNSYQGTVVANAAIVPSGTNGSISVYAEGSTELIIDITGYFTQQSTSAVDQINQDIGQINQQITQVNQQISQQGSQLTQQISQQGSQLVQQISQISQQAALVNQHTTQIGQINQQINGFTQQINQVNQQATQIGQQATQITQQINHLNQQFANVGQALTDFHSDGTKQNIAVGYNSLQANSSGNGNTVAGSGALSANISGSNNVGVGAGVLSGNLSGNSNIAIGYQAGSGLADTSNAIAIGNVGQPNDTGIIRIGTPNIHTSTFIAGITGATVGDVGQPVMIDEFGQLGTLQSSIRYKEDIRDIGEASDALMSLRPVQFRYRHPAANGNKPLQYGLIAEEVAGVFPDLVVHNQQGEIETVKYYELPALLLNELQKEHRIIEQQKEEIQSQHEEMRNLLIRLAALEASQNR